jgi:hypothetical protein
MARIILEIGGPRLPGRSIPGMMARLKFDDHYPVKTVAAGGHFDAMVNPGIGLAIEWLQGLPGEQPPAVADESPGETP